ncbi:MAG: HAMP domain-containing protein [Thiothrix sp.]|nr:HAMP domain-containing protein [Thiothrix sp.]
MLRWLPVTVIGILLAISLGMLYQATQNLGDSNSFRYLLYLNAFILATLVLAILLNLVRIIYQWHTRQAGSRFTLRLMIGFLVLTLLPVSVVSFFSMNLIGKNVDRQLSTSIEGALEDSLELAHYSLMVRSRVHLMDLAELAKQLPGSTKLEISALMDDWRMRRGAHEVILLSEGQHYIATSVDEVDSLIPFFTVRDLLRNMTGRNEYVHIESVHDVDGEEQLFARVALRVVYGLDEQIAILTALFTLSEREELLARNVSDVRNEYKSISYNREALKDALRMALLVIAILTVLFSLWAAFIFSRRLTQPVRDLVEGTLAVASGDLKKKLPVSDRDDFSLLARSFNTMTKRLFSVQEEREQARRQLQKEHDYLDVVLEHLSSGVVTLDGNMIIRRINSAASQILGHSMQNQVGLSFGEACRNLERLQPFVDALSPWLAAPEQDWQAEVVLASDQGRQVLVCRGAGLPKDSVHQQGHVLVFEDVTDVVQAEHDAAWSEVARRLAHEIKNPLTPIQLSAERLHRKLGGKLEPELTDFLERMTRTIIQQVDTLKAMVNAFSEYAKAPMLAKRPVDLNQLVAEVVELYQDNPGQVRLVLQQDRLPSIMLDPHRMRQLLVNLVKNALEAIGEQPSGGGEIRINTFLDTGLEGEQAVLTLQDNGPGIPESLLPHLFEPYVTSKHKGTGLGLAIVKKIVEEHDGSLGARNLETGGAMISITLPVGRS